MDIIVFDAGSESERHQEGSFRRIKSDQGVGGVRGVSVSDKEDGETIQSTVKRHIKGIRF